MTCRMRLVDYVAAELERMGVRYVFGVGGANIEDLYEAVHRAPGRLRGVVAKHEFSAVTMADGCARATARIGVVAATSGGGAMNLVPGLAEAHASRIPVLALVGQPPTFQEGRGAFQDSSGKAGSFDALDVFAPVSRFCARVSEPDAIPGLLARAITVAQTEPRGPAVLLLPKDAQQGHLEVPAHPGSAAPAHTGASARAARTAAHTPPAVRGAGEAARPAGAPRAPAAPQPDPARLAEAVGVLEEASRVVVIAGEGAAGMQAREQLARLVRHLGACVAVSPDAKDVYDNRSPRFTGVAGVMGHPEVEDCLRRADACLLVGTRLPVLARGRLEALLTGMPVVCVDPEPPFVAAIPLLGPVAGTLRTLERRLSPRPSACPAHHPPSLQRPPAPSRAAPGYTAVAGAIAGALPQDAHVFVDAGNVGAAVIHALPAPRFGRFVVAVGMGGMGYTFGAGIGAALATGRRTYVVAGDGAFFMHGMEMHTALEYGAPVTFVVLNNNAHAMCVTREELFQGGARPENVFHPSRIAAGASAMFPRLRVETAGTPAQLRSALLRSNDAAGPALVAMDLDHRETPPFQPFLTALATGPGAAAPGHRPNHDEEKHTHDRPIHVG
ncbi:thiamine pyrophosphate-binding protein [Streptomyces sp. FXJ1.172]|uniref:thiamine pyrophosphate-binding protein n=1 Tax=Streptomyces sp. FXJ1.172 TaxID=710705 RepID=UPI0008311E18|nr:thiamine pyrophosphate-binding protein [Streptomyces sp. FXJ1.172]WEO94247.1 thiamine pyrophosphate-binding protein [Streptomyces sp. FXJ1.172]